MAMHRRSYCVHTTILWQLTVFLRRVFCDHGDATVRSVRSHGDCTALLVHWRHYKTKSNFSDSTQKVIKEVGGIFESQLHHQYMAIFMIQLTAHVQTISCPIPPAPWCSFSIPPSITRIKSALT